jgi:hypothetical protein
MVGRVHDSVRRRAIAARSASRSRPREGIVMFDGTDMSTPVTRGELREELEKLGSRFEQKLETLEHRFDQKLETLDQKFDQKLRTGLEAWGNVLLARIDASEQRLLTELARHTKAIHESMAAQISIIDEKYADLPGRVSRLEAKVFAP